jgi:hypothetical protein
LKEEPGRSPSVNGSVRAMAFQEGSAHLNQVD